jgi:hypothetical protein
MRPAKFLSISTGFLSPVLMLLLCLAIPAQAAFDQSHRLLSAELKKYADKKGIHYRMWKEHPELLDKYLSGLADVSPDEYQQFSPDQKKAFWINAYNSIIIRIVLDHYPVHGTKAYYPPNSARQIPNLWEVFKYKVAGQEINLYDIEHKIIRREFKDPRMHFAVVCAARGCPTLADSAYTGGRLEDDLNLAAQRYMTDSNHVQYDPEHNVIKVSKLFQWFPLDFLLASAPAKMPMPPPADDEIVFNYALAFAPREIREKYADTKKVEVVYLPYDWSLNDADEP